MTKPAIGDFAPYYEPYMALLPNKEIVEMLQEQAKELPAFFVAISPEKEVYRYAEGKWTPKEILGHIIDTERIMGYRALCIGRGDKTPFPGFDENEYIKNSKFNERTMFNLLEEFEAVRAANIFLAQSFNEDELQRRGTANNKEVTANALLHIIVGHTKHHMNIIEKRYLI